MRTIAFDSFPKDEQDIFRSSCLRWRRNPNDFIVKAVEPDSPDDPPNRPKREVFVTYVPSSRGRSYRADVGSRWIGDFEDDLQLVYFGRLGQFQPSS